VTIGRKVERLSGFVGLVESGALVLVVYLGLYCRAVRQDWMGLDDYTLLLNNRHLGDGLASFLWGLKDLNFGRRWTPMLWTVANFAGDPTVLHFHLLVLVLGAVFSVLVLLCYREVLSNGWALFASLVFVCSPMRLEVFAWEMGFVYVTVGIWLCLAFLLRARPWGCCYCCMMALCTYPAAAGAVLVAIWIHRRSLAGWVLAAFLVVIACFQLMVRREIGFVPWHPRFDLVAMVPLHYALSVFVPFATIPVFPAVWYWPLLLGAAVIGVAWAAKPGVLGVWFVLLSPVFLAAITESFWFGARYALVTDLAVYAYLVRVVAGDSGRCRSFLSGCVLLCFVWLNLSDGSYANGIWGIGMAAVREARLVGAPVNPLFFRELRLVMIVREAHVRAGLVRETGKKKP